MAFFQSIGLVTCFHCGNDMFSLSCVCLSAVSQFNYFFILLAALRAVVVVVVVVVVVLVVVVAEYF